jgi:signal transduction histidine kinase
MAELANTMLNLARLDAGSEHIEQEVVDLAAVAGEVARRVASLALEKELAIQVEGERPVLVVGDRLLLQQAALVLADNAIKYNRPAGHVLLRVTGQEDKAYLEVRDTGIGIAPEHVPHLGERFYRVDKARSREVGGAGLGLSIAQSIAAQHGGALEINSEPGQGTTATLVLPAARINQGKSRSYRAPSARSP